MADLESVTNTLATTIAGLLTDAPTGYPTRVFPGWPLTNDLIASLAAGQVMISVFPMPGASSNVTRHESNWRLLTPSVITTTYTAAGGVVTFGGTITLPLNVRIANALYAAQVGDTLADIASGITSALHVQGIPATSNGASVTVDSTDVQFGSKATFVNDSFRTKQVFMISIWAPSPAARAATANAFQGNLFGTPRLTLEDGSTGIILFQREGLSDHSEVEGLYRRDMYASVEYSVFEFADAWDVLKVVQTTTGPNVHMITSSWGVGSRALLNVDVELDVTSTFTAGITVSASL